MIAITLSRLRWARWQLRYWVLDKYREHLRGYAFFAAVCLTVLGVVRLYLQARELAAAPAHAPVQAVFNLLLQLLLLVVSALLSYALAPKQPEQKPAVPKSPVVEDGRSIRKIYGTRWIDDPTELGWKAMGITKIKAKGGKK